MQSDRHSHKRIHEQECYADQGAPFLEGRHSPKHLAERVIVCSKFRDNSRTTLQKVMLNKFTSGPIYKLYNMITDVEDIAVVTAYYHLFNEVFFFHTLTGRCTIQLTSWNSLTCKAPEQFGHIKNKRQSRHWLGRDKKLQRIFTIQIYVDVNQERKKRLTDCLGTLLHEMVHGFLYCWTCTDGSCQENVKKQEMIGLTDHGYVFLDIGYALQNAVRDPKFLGLEDFSVNLSESVMMEADVSGDEALKHLERWGLEMLDEYRDT